MSGVSCKSAIVLFGFMLLYGCSGGVTQRPATSANPLPERAGELPVKAYAALPEVEHISLSPDGNRIAFLQNLDGNTILVTQDRVGGGNRHIVVRSDNQKFHINGYNWVNDERLLVRVWYADRAARLKFVRTGLFAVNHDGTQLKDDLIRVDVPGLNNRYVPQIQDSYFRIPGDPRHVLLSLDDRQAGAPSVYRLDVYSGEKERVAGNPGNVRHWFPDLQGRVRVGVGVNKSKLSIVYRPPEGGEWRTLGEYEQGHADALEPLGFDADPDLLYVRGIHQGRKAVFRIRLSNAAGKPELVYADPKYDVAGALIYSAAHDRVIGVGYATDTLRFAYWNESGRRLQAAIDKALPQRSNVIVSSAGRRHIVSSSNAARAPVYYAMDEDTGFLDEIAETYPLLADARLSPPQTVKFKARDGLELEGYLTRPTRAGTGPGPAIIFPHGGPWARDVAGFDPWTQFLADRGWTVLRLNFRGSAGYGADFERAGFQRWGLEMQDDITDGVHWLIQQKLADPQKVCIVGGSYGGYAALMGAIKTPELYRCAVSLAPVTDLTRLVDELNDARWLDYQLRSALADRKLGRRWSDRDRLNDTSPLQQAARLHTPLLLAHGTDDLSVDVSHSQDLAKELESAGFKDFQYLELEHGDHHLSREVDRVQFFGALDAFLRKFQ
ncbi:S9 family peptidase [Methylococcus sp. EFPC2]|uniref:alpha/beta hydrolase family protein n=1 Tax=Methylococcus sp. EFPC2 TaxID=2812648 RepID=UPI001966EB28|nr:alpha/beta fold hydrolase [Methylococcus sp. EFPC2]QSA96503.1 S9 family peptidase [Methylococcus sp. EFPC2]